MNKKKERSYQEQFMEQFIILTRSRNTRRVWSDFVQLSACVISNCVDKKFFDRRKEQYLKIMGGYSKDECEIFAQLLTITTIAYAENPRQNFLGDRFRIDLKLLNEKFCRFYTPNHVGRLTSKKQIDHLKQEIIENGYVTVSDCCCGVGYQLMEFANTAKDWGINYQDTVIFVAQDVDPVAAITCYVQLALLGCAGYVIAGNSLSNEFPQQGNIWCTPMFVLKRSIYRNWSCRKIKIHI